MKLKFLLFGCLFTLACGCRLQWTKEDCLDTCGCAYCPVFGCYSANDDEKPICFSGWDYAPFTSKCAKTILIIVFWAGVVLAAIGLIYSIIWLWYRYQMKKIDPTEIFCKC